VNSHPEAEIVRESTEIEATEMTDETGTAAPNAAGRGPRATIVVRAATMER